MDSPENGMGFGITDTFDGHHFRVEIPAARDEPISIVEHSGARHMAERIIPRVRLARHIWPTIADSAGHEFNARLKAAQLPIGQWRTGSNRMDRLLGKELCVFAWAAETATAEQILIIANNWTAMGAPERWWLFHATMAEAGRPEDRQRGWRRALFVALSDG